MVLSVSSIKFGFAVFAWVYMILGGIRSEVMKRQGILVAEQAVRTEIQEISSCFLAVTQEVCVNGEKNNGAFDDILPV